MTIFYLICFPLNSLYNEMSAGCFPNHNQIKHYQVKHWGILLQPWLGFCRTDDSPLKKSEYLQHHVYPGGHTSKWSGQFALLAGSFSESARDCLKWPSFNCLNHFYKRCVTLSCLMQAIFLLDHRGSTKDNKYVTCQSFDWSIAAIPWTTSHLFIN